MSNRRANSASTSARLLTVLAVAVATISGCVVNPSAPAEIAIGYVYPLSGSQAATGADLQRGLELAAELVNGEYDLDLPLARRAGLPGLGGARIKLIASDHAGSPDQGEAVTKKLIKEHQVVAVVGAYNSSVTGPASQAAEAAGIPFINPDSTAPVLTQRGFRWFFRTTADDAIFVQNFYDFLADLKAKHGASPASVAVVYENSVFGTSVGQLEVARAAQAGLTVSADIPYLATAPSVDGEARRVQSTQADIVMQSSYDQDAILFMRAYKALNYRPQAILAMDAGFISPAFITTLGDDANYVLSREVWAADLAATKPLIGQVNDLYREKYGVGLTGNSARAFTALLVLADAINRARSTDAEEIREALLDTDLPADQLIMPWDGVQFDAATGQNVLARGIIVQIQHGAYYTVWPWDLASVELIWPMPPWGQ